jgi:hypothetical protein
MADKHKVLVGLNYNEGDGRSRRAEPGDVVADLPERSIRALVEAGAIEPADDDAKVSKVRWEKLAGEVLAGGGD